MKIKKKSIFTFSREKYPKGAQNNARSFKKYVSARKNELKSGVGDRNQYYVSYKVLLEIKYTLI